MLSSDRRAVGIVSSPGSVRLALALLKGREESAGGAPKGGGVVQQWIGGTDAGAVGDGVGSISMNCPLRHKYVLKTVSVNRIHGHQ